MLKYASNASYPVSVVSEILARFFIIKSDPAEYGSCGICYKMLIFWRFTGSGRIGDRGGRALPSIENRNNVRSTEANVGGPPQHAGFRKPDDGGNIRGSSRVRSNRGGSGHQTNRPY